MGKLVFEGKVCKKVYKFDDIYDHKLLGLGIKQLGVCGEKEALPNEILLESEVDHANYFEEGETIIINGERLTIEEKVYPDVENIDSIIYITDHESIIDDVESYKKAKDEEVEYWKKKEEEARKKNQEKELVKFKPYEGHILKPIEPKKSWWEFY